MACFNPHGGLFWLCLVAVPLAGPSVFAGELAYPGFEYESRFATLPDGTRMHYVEQGEGDPLVLLHGVPTSAYLWRNIIPHLSDTHRVIAVDLPNFGKSDRSAPKTVPELAAAFEGFVETLGLQNVSLGLHDWGGPIGFQYAANNPDNIRALAFFETLITPAPDFSIFPFAFGTPDIADPVAWRQTVVEDNYFIEQLLLNPAKGFIGVDLPEADKDQHRLPFLDPAAREQLAIMPYQVPVVDGTGHPILDPDGDGGVPPAIHPNLGLVQQNLDFLGSTPEIPKLLLATSPGTILPFDFAGPLAGLIPGLQIGRLGGPEDRGFHFVQEDLPQELGLALSDWADSLVVPEPSGVAISTLAGATLVLGRRGLPRGARSI